MSKGKYDLVMEELKIRRETCPDSFTVHDLLRQQSWKLEALWSLQRREIYLRNYLKLQRGMSKLTFSQ